MKRIFTYLILFTISAYVCQAQRYDTEIFSEVQVTSDVVYGVNGTVLFLPVVGEVIPEALLMDIYEPVGDTETERPLVLVFHTGNFLPPVTNGQIAGSKTDSSAVEICTQLAKRGFVAASVTYRLGWNPLAETQPERALGLIQAAYRGLQDGRTAIRFFKMDYDNGNTYGIDQDKITCWGNGTGGYLVLGMNGLSFYNEIPLTTNGPGKFLLDVIDASDPANPVPGMDGVPETPMVVEAYHGDINGEVTTVVPDAAFGIPAGDTSNYANHVGYSNDFQLTVNVGGAIGDISWLDDQAVPIISVQSAFDIFAPYDDAVLIVPTTGDPIVRVQGLQQIGASQEASGINQAWKDFSISDAITTTATDNSATAGHDYYEGSFPWIQPVNSLGLDEGVVINWWDPSDPAPGQGMGIPWNMLPHPSGGTFHDQGLVLNEDMSAAKSRANIAEIMDYVIPRMCITLGLGCEITSTDEIILDQKLISIAPNPTTGLVNVKSVENQPIQNIEVYSVTGQLMSVDYDINATQSVIDLNSQTPGMYLMKIYLENGVVGKKIMVQ